MTVAKGTSLIDMAIESPEKFRLSFEAAPLAMVVTSEAGEILDFNPAALALSGYPEAELRGMGVDRLYEEPRGRPAILAALRRDGRIQGDMVRFRDRSGATIPARVHAERFRLPNGLEVVFSTIEDLRGFHEAHAQLAESVERFRMLFENAHDAIFFTDVGGRLVEANPAALSLFEASPADIERTNVAELYADPGSRARIRETLERDGEVCDAVVRFRTLRGRDFTGRLTAKFRRDAEGRVQGIQGTVSDITARVEAEENLRRSASLLSAVFEASPLAIIGTDLEWRLTLWNPAAERLYGWTAAEVMGRDVALLVPPDNVEAYRELRKQALSGVPPRQVVSPRVRKDGSRFDASLSFAAIHVDGDVPTGIMVVAEDVTERNRMEARLRQGEKLEAVGRLAGGVAHDFNNILTIILAEASLLKSAAPAGSDIAASAAQIESASLRAAALTKQLLAFSRQQVLEPKRLDLNEVVREGETMLRRVIRADVRIVTDLTAKPCEALADATQLQQVLLNLCLNARDAMPGGGVLRIHTATRTARIPVMTVNTTLPPGEYAVLQVSDTGTGMDESTLARVFEPFFTTKEERGNGLGLPSVLGIVQQSEGGITVESTVGQGTTFTVYLPRVK